MPANLPPNHPVFAVPATEWRRLYCDEELSGSTLAGRFGVGHQTIRRRLAEAGIALRSKREQLAADVRRGRYRQDAEQREEKRAAALGSRYTPRPRHGADHVPAAAVAIRYQAGERPAELAAEFGCSRQRIYQILDAAGVPRRSRKRTRTPRKTAFADLLTPAEWRIAYEGHSAYELARIWGVRAGIVEKALRKHGIALRGRGPRACP